jgi:hypothetical protein
MGNGQADASSDATAAVVGTDASLSASDATDAATDMDAPEAVSCATPQVCADFLVNSFPAGYFPESPIASCCINKACVYGQAAIDAVRCTDADVQLIVASNYDQSCKIDSDCGAMAEGNFCIPGANICPSAAAINRSAYPKYQTDVAKTTASFCQTVPGGCGLAFGACCRRGLCQNGIECSDSASLPEGGAGADSGDGSAE